MKQLLIFIFCFLVLSCVKKSDNPTLEGVWISEFNDTLNVTGLITYTNYNPLNKYLFDYKIKNDSILLRPAQSNLYENWKGYSYSLTKNKLILRKFFSHEELNFTKN